MTVLTPPPATDFRSPPGVIRRLLGRLRHGLLIQELLDRIARFGLVCYPYFLVLHAASPASAARPLDGINTRLLGPDDVPDMVAITKNETAAQSYHRLLSEALCMGLYHDGKLVAQVWAALAVVPIPGSQSQPLLRLRPQEAYLFDAYVAPAWRGRGLAARVRVAMQVELARLGRTSYFSTTLAFNRSARRFRAALAAREVELRLFLRLRVGALPGIDLRLRRWQPHLELPWIRRVPASGRAVVRD